MCSGPALPTATINLHTSQFWPMLMRGSRGLAESYAQRMWDSPDLVAVIRLAARNAVVIDRVRSWTAPLWTPAQRVRAALHRSTRQRSRRDIAAHYDLGNELFSRMLDPTMMYSCAMFERDGMTLEEASIAKLERVCQPASSSAPRTGCWRSAPAGAGSPSMPPAPAAVEVTTTTISSRAARLRGRAGPRGRARATGSPC